MPRKSKSIKKRYFGVNTSELALVFSIAITLFVAGVMTGGVQLTTRSDARMPRVTPKPVVDGVVPICGACEAASSDAGKEAGNKCQPGFYCQVYYRGDQVQKQCVCLQNKDGTYDSKECQNLADGGSIAVPAATGAPGKEGNGNIVIKGAENSCWKCQKSDFKIPGSLCP